MVRKTNFLMMLAFLFCVSLTGYAQMAAVGGKVQQKQADGTFKPVAQIDVACYRTDINASCLSTKTGSKGDFTIAGVPADATVALGISGPGISPTFYPGIKPGATNLVIEVEAGDGKAITEAEVRQAVANFNATQGNLTEEQKKQQAEYEKNLKEVTEKNSKIEEKNKIIKDSLEMGLKAFNSGDLDTAIEKWTEGINADPDFIGSAPVLLNNRGTALKKRAVDLYNAAVKSKDSAAVTAAKTKARNDLSLALKSFSKSFDLLSKTTLAESTTVQNSKEMLSLAIDGGRDSVRLMSAISIVDPDQAAEAAKLVNEYVTNEPDKAKKIAALNSLADYLLMAGDFDGSSKTYKSLLVLTPGDPDALAQLGIALYSMGKGQESLNYLDIYIKTAPKTHPLRDGVLETIKELTTVQKLKPQKVN